MSGDFGYFLSSLFHLIFNIIFYILLFLLYELEEIKPMRRPSVVTVSHSLRSF